MISLENTVALNQEPVALTGKCHMSTVQGLLQRLEDGNVGEILVLQGGGQLPGPLAPNVGLLQERG